MKGEVDIKHVYEPASRKDGMRILVDRIWPRGLRKEAASLDLWLKEIAPSTELRKWYGHQPERWPEFQRRYKEELKDHKTELQELLDLVRERHVTLLYAAHDGEKSNAQVLKQVISRKIQRKPAASGK